MTKEDEVSCMNLIAEAEMFKKVPPQDLQKIVRAMHPRLLQRNEEFIPQGGPTDRFFLLQSGDIRRSYYNETDGKTHTVKFAIKAKSINSMRILSGDPSFSTVKCVSEEGCKVYQMYRHDFFKVLESNPQITVKIAEGLCQELRRGSKTFQTPLLEQHSQEVNVPAVSIAAGIESYYRSALNAKLNARLTGIPAELFPNMHIQVPTRVAYITGFKGLRALLDSNVDPDLYDSPNAIRLATAISPGVLMTPISSVLEASNAGHMNSEPMTTRWMRGALPRGGREIIFGVGLNQMSDYCEERIAPYCKGHDLLANAAGSLLAGVVSGYLSHVPHNLSTLKLLEPHRSYRELYPAFVDKSVPAAVERAVASWPTTTKFWTRTLFATLFPRGVMIRTTQIVGSFMILNGTINYLQLREHHKIQRHMKGTDEDARAPVPAVASSLSSSSSPVAAATAAAAVPNR
ncbi:cNMP [Seminavis robusta]|uniref:CNMP n=1 Tax=Seminavis robusta TaxID=568900 RepID=A0A9N8DH07_9STRA|nr:cNMP [Seminavis robusta]|eukprot:Sro122_g059150.1 cNMP (459) ;mRNA; r:30190-31566